MKSRRRFDSSFKAKVAFEAIKERETIESLCKKFELSPTQINEWKKDLITNGRVVFEGQKVVPNNNDSKQIDELYRQIGELQVANTFLKKKLLTNP
jgi:transposase-like protein